MTEEEWLACQNPNQMLDFVRDRASDRKLRLFAAAFCRSIWDLFFDTRSRHMVEAAEQAADRILDRKGLALAFERSREVVGKLNNPYGSAGNHRKWRIAAAARDAGRATAWSAACNTAWSVPASVDPTGARGSLAERASAVTGAAILRDIFGDLFRPAILESALLLWDDGTARTFAQSIYQNRLFDHLPILADALEDAGCTDCCLLAHLRDEGPHVLGCWALDLVLGNK